MADPNKNVVFIDDLKIDSGVGGQGARHPSITMQVKVVYPGDGASIAQAVAEKVESAVSRERELLKNQLQMLLGDDFYVSVGLKR